MPRVSQLVPFVHWVAVSVRPCEVRGGGWWGQVNQPVSRAVKWRPETDGGEAWLLLAGPGSAEAKGSLLRRVRPHSEWAALVGRVWFGARGLVTRDRCEQIGPRIPSSGEGQKQAWTLDCLASRPLSCPQLARGMSTLCQFNNPELLLCEGPLLGIGDTTVTKRDKCLFTWGADVLLGGTVKSLSKRVKCAAVWMTASAGDTIK